LIEKLDGFIRKYYQNRLIKGIILSLSMLLFAFLLISLSEYWGNFDVLTRSIFFYSYLMIALAILAYYIFIPVFQLLKIGRRLSYEEAAKIIGKHFPNIKDKLLNTLQLSKMMSEDSPNVILLEAGIQQKTQELKPINFRSVIDFKINTQYLKYLLIPLVLFFSLFIYSPDLITEPTQRILEHNTVFEKKLPFEITLKNKSLDVLQYEDCLLQIGLEGDAFPEQVYLLQNNNLLPLEKQNPASYQHRFKRIQKDIRFRLQAGAYKSQEYRIHVIPKPLLLQMEISLNYPAYTGKENENVGQSGNLTIPEGTKVHWKFYTKNTGNIKFLIRTDSLLPSKKEGNLFEFQKNIYQSCHYQVSFTNQYVDTLGAIDYSIRVVKDAYPQIYVEEYADSTLKENLFFRSIVKDDYGFQKMQFVFQKMNEKGEIIQKKRIDIPINLSQSPQEVFYQYNFMDLLQKAGESVHYYFEIWDNDAINGSKSSKSQLRSFKAPTHSELQKKTNKTTEEIKEGLKKMTKDAKELKKDIKAFNRKLFEQKELNWEDKQKLKELLQRQAELKQKAEQLQQKSIENRKENEKFSEIDKSLLEKQKQLEEILEELKKNEELNKLLEELQKMMEEAKKEDVEDMLQKMQMDNKEMEKLLDQNLELFKKLQLEMKMEENLKKIEELAQKQEKLSEETREKKNSAAEQKEKQDQLNEEFKDWEKEMDKMEKMNQELEKPQPMEDMQQEKQETEQEMKKSSEKLEKNQARKASKAQKSAAQKMKKMAQQMSSMMQSQQSGAQEDIESLKQILDNLIHLSFAQEELMDKLDNISVNNPQYIKLVQEQKNINTEFQIVDDSLTALGKRQAMIAPFISKEIAKVEQGMNQSLETMESRRSDFARFRQQSAMTSLNNLALMLSEVLNQMQNQSNASSSCNSGQPKQGQNPKPGTMKDLRKQLQQQIQQMKDGMNKEKGKQKNKKGMSEKLARMAAEQRAIRETMQKMAQEMEKEGQGRMAKELKRAAREMNKTETELVNKMLTAETLIRQQEIITRLLKSEKAELQREKDKKREAKTGQNPKNRSLLSKKHFMKKNQGSEEVLKSIPPELKYFYKKKVNEYFFHFDEK
jgi:hypothetical protein